MNQRKLDDLDFYEKYLLNAGQAERDKYIEEHPDFLNDYPVSYEHRELLQDELYRKLLRRIRAYETVDPAVERVRPVTDKVISDIGTVQFRLLAVFFCCFSTFKQPAFRQMNRTAGTDQLNDIKIILSSGNLCLADDLIIF